MANRTLCHGECMVCSGTIKEPNQVFLVYPEGSIDPNDKTEYHARDVKEAEKLVGMDKWPVGVKIIIQAL